MTVQTKTISMTIDQVAAAMRNTREALYDAFYEADELPSYLFNHDQYAQANNIKILQYKQTNIDKKTIFCYYKHNLYKNKKA